MTTKFDCCRNCQDRVQWCHHTCEKYLAVKAERDRIKAISEKDRESRLYAIANMNKVADMYIRKRKHHMNTRARRR